MAETLTRGLDRVITLADIGLEQEDRAAPPAPGWSVDALTTLATLGSTDMDIERRQVLAQTAYSVTGLVLPSEAERQQAAERARARKPLSRRTVTLDDVAGVREMTTFLSRRDQERGGHGVGRAALVAYLRTDVVELFSPASPPTRCVGP
ncbi:hypothetical protein [Streptomyces sp. NPDC085466]|uniref:hypothetical protein n=1 Tax=Streptomyces sp. NPDC085466 TaxID=3365725 RepID=UPI0037D67747